MKRYFIVVGDQTTRGGSVTEGDSRARIRGKAQSYHGAHVYCPSCKSEGHIVGAGPTRRHSIHGKQAALEGDLCACKCEPPPRLIASMRNASMSFEAKELASMGYASDGAFLSQSRDSAFDRHFRFVDERGQPVTGIRVQLVDVDGHASAVITDADGRTPVKSGGASQRIGVALREARR
ncbi:PAAR repeat-containing protein [Caballeronia arvi]|uniref:PAAR repeat-containing protein n=1 Tax=Caballeronia arvi TaxID=1777135 RepID=A0A158FL46_9BURK|nr:PAAR domain-containing protein [Caballeronia arvi]SAL19790.1 PAAR repeat-containing protein [Caballeronia arvi]